LAIESEEEHAKHFYVRDSGSEGLRPVQRYLDALPDIRVIQDAILERAGRFGVPVVENTELGRTITTVMELIFASAERLQAVTSGGTRG